MKARSPTAFLPIFAGFPSPRGPCSSTVQQPYAQRVLAHSPGPRGRICAGARATRMCAAEEARGPVREPPYGGAAQGPGTRRTDVPHPVPEPSVRRRRVRLSSPRRRHPRSHRRRPRHRRRRSRRHRRSLRRTSDHRGGGCRRPMPRRRPTSCRYCCPNRGDRPRSGSGSGSARRCRSARPGPPDRSPPRRPPGRPGLPSASHFLSFPRSEASLRRAPRAPLAAPSRAAGRPRRRPSLSVVRC